jgi:hypothetical protein
MPIELEIVRVTDHEPLQPPRLRMQGRQTHQLALDQLPLRQRVDEEAAVPVHSDHQFPLGALDDLLPITGGHDHPAFLIERDFCSAAKHELLRGIYPSPPTFSHSLPL